MIDINKFYDRQENAIAIETSLAGHALLHTPALNKGTAFTLDERRELGLFGLLPDHVETIGDQAARVYEQYAGIKPLLARNIFLNALHNHNEVLFYRLLQDHIEEMMPVIYTPEVGEVVKSYSHVFRRPQGLYLSCAYKGDMEAMFDNRPFEEVDAVCVTDGEGVLGIGDQGVGGMEIPVAKLMLYTLCAGIDPTATLPVLLDVGTDNETLLNDPYYLGLRRKRLRGAEYDDFVDHFVRTVKRKLPRAFLHFEDFGRENARPVLDRYRERLCVFNDDIQGTGAIAVAVLRAALNAVGGRLADQRILIFGAGTAGTGIADMVRLAAMEDGLPPEDATRLFWLVDTRGLIVEGGQDMTSGQKRYARAKEEVSGWTVSTLEEVVKEVRPTILIGTSGQGGAFTGPVISRMAAHVDRPIIFPLSNPTALCEATPSDLLTWTGGRAVVATGSPFAPVSCKGRTYTITQCNNAFIFPGIALGAIASQAMLLTDQMILAAVKALSGFRRLTGDVTAGLLPPLSESVALSRQVAVAVGLAALKEGLTMAGSEDEIVERVEAKLWRPQYRRIKKRNLA